MKQVHSGVVDQIGRQDAAGDSATSGPVTPVDRYNHEGHDPGNFIRFPSILNRNIVNPDIEQHIRSMPFEVKREATTGNVINSGGHDFSRHRVISSSSDMTGPKSEKPEKLRLKKPKSGVESNLDIPPTPWGCEWREVEDGWNLWRYWTEKDRISGARIKKERYLGSLSREAWEVLKGYDNETIISNIGKRFRRHGRS